MPQPQVRSDPAKRLLPAQASLYGYVETDYPLATPHRPMPMKRSWSEIEARIKPLRQEIRRIEEPYRDIAAAGKVQEVSGKNADRDSKFLKTQRTPGQVLLASR